MFKNTRNRIKNEKGLTLIELLAVIVILGIIAAIAIPAIGGIIQKSKEDAVKSEALQVLNAARLYVSGEPLLESENSIILEVGDISKVDNHKENENNPKLDSYIEDLDEDSGYIVNVEDGTDGYTYQISGSGVAGKKIVKFENATIQDINDNKTDKVKVEDKLKDKTNQG